MTNLKIQFVDSCSTLVLILLMKRLSHPSAHNNTDRTIVIFLRKKDCDQVMKVKTEPKKLKPSDFDLPEGTKNLH